MKEHFDSEVLGILNEAKGGKVLSDESIVSLIEKRVGLFDCGRGWILDGLPLNKKQCELLNRRGIVPTSVISLRMSDVEIKRRVLSKSKEGSVYDYYP